ncbi:MAG: histone deacetylase [Bacteroidia bacterium]|nr:histone deacetylase [Bacteroidia bacterium]
MLKISWSPLYEYPLPEGHRFPMEKYSLIPEQLLYEGSISESNLYTPGLLSEEVLLLTHTKTYWNKLKQGQLSKKEIRKTGFPFSPLLVERGRTIAQGTIENSLYAMANGVAINGAGGTHHAFTDRGEGFCLINDIAIAANYLLNKGLISKALVVDLDVHQGNGTAEIFQGNNAVYTFSMHCEANYPLKKEQSDLDISLPIACNDESYLEELYNILPRLIDNEEPDIIFYLSGVDVLATDKLGKLALSKEACKRRDAFVLEECKKNNIPVSVSLGGGYSHHIRDIIEAHCNTFRMAQEIFF